ncbi:EAL domain-containing protein [Sinomonas susongensis]|uniref:EAL domain-containing protein n=1 Tax=Sinomonas susongensis TaxID=1324851 RepID=UPI001108DCEE|nr:EAL domain-containing protein [Sinomonas susongensis]
MTWMTYPTVAAETIQFLDEVGAAASWAARSGGGQSVLLLLDTGFSGCGPFGLGAVPLQRSLEVVEECIHGTVGEERVLVAFAGGKLAVLVRRFGPRRAAALARRIQQSLAAARGVGGIVPAPLGSVGVRTVEPGTAPEDVLEEAWIALEEARTLGPGSVQVFDPEMLRRRRRRSALAEDLEASIRTSQVQLAYQPIVRLPTGAVSGAEALARWRHPVLGSIPPLEFIPLAEEFGLGPELAQLVVTTALGQLRAWTDSRSVGPGFTLSVNASNSQLASIVQTDALRHVLSTTGIDPESLAVELTEESFVSGTETDTAAMRRLRALGVGLHIDDFGSGYSSIGYLSRLPATLVKVDRTLLGDPAGNPRDRRLVAAVLDIVGAYGLEAVFEGIENAGQAEELWRLGAVMGQGYHFSVPLHREAMTAFLRRRHLPTQGH